VTSKSKPDKVRVVLDCAAKYKGVSLNDVVHQGPDLLKSLHGVLMRFRDKPIAFVADIESMYYQVQVAPAHRDCLRYVWWHVGTKENPADHVSRGMTAQNLVTCKNWAQGPWFLWQEEGQWSNERVNVPDVLDDDNECIKGTNIYVTEVANDACQSEARRRCDGIG
jgi:hypothetical protein